MHVVFVVIFVIYNYEDCVPSVAEMECLCVGLAVVLCLSCFLVLSVTLVMAG